MHVRSLYRADLYNLNMHMAQRSIHGYKRYALTITPYSLPNSLYYAYEDLTKIGLYSILNAGHRLRDTSERIIDVHTDYIATAGATDLQHAWE